MATQPRICIGVPVYNGGALFGEMIESLLAQTYGDFEIFIADNCSTDATEEVARGFEARDRRVHYHRNATNIGASPNFNRVLELAGACDYFKWAAHDDLYRPAWLERCVEVLNDQPEVVLAYTVVDVVDETDDHLLSRHPFYKFGCLESSTDALGRPVWKMGPLHLAETVDPAARYHEFLNRMVACFPIFGLIRAAVLPGTGLHRSYFGSDRTLLGELVLRGRFRQVEERLYINRYHKSVGRLVPSNKQQAWIGSSGGSQLPPQVLQYIDLLRAPLAAGLSAADSVRCFTVASTHIARRQAGRLIRLALPTIGYPTTAGQAPAGPSAKP